MGAAAARASEELEQARGHGRAHLPENRHERSLTEKGRFTAHVRASDEESRGTRRDQAEVVWNEVPASEIDERVASAFDLEIRRVIDRGPGPAGFPARGARGK